MTCTQTAISITACDTEAFARGARSLYKRGCHDYSNLEAKHSAAEEGSTGCGSACEHVENTKRTQSINFK